MVEENQLLKSILWSLYVHTPTINAENKYAGTYTRQHENSPSENTNYSAASKQDEHSCAFRKYKQKKVKKKM